MNRIPLVTLAVALLAATASAAPLQIGDPAPPLTLAKWLTGPPVAPEKADGVVEVVEFWATWCPPCRESIPHLSELQKKYKARGVVFVGISNEDEATVRPFMTEMKMDYRVALDDSNKTMDRWLEGVPGIPHAFIVGKDGRILWSGHPMFGLDRALEQVVAGTYDVAAARKESDLVGQLNATEDSDAQLKLVNELLKMDPKNDGYQQMKIGILQAKGDSAGVAAARKEAAQAMSGSPDQQNRMAWSLATDEDVTARDLAMAYDLASRAVAATNRKNAAYLDTLARVYYAAGLLEKAVATEKEALAAAPGAQYKDAVQNALTYYENAVKLRNRINAGK